MKRTTIVPPVLLALALLAPSTPAAASEPVTPGAPIFEGIPWALTSEDDLHFDSQDLRARQGGPGAAEVEGFWQGSMYFGPDSGAQSLLAAQGREPLPAVNYDPTPGIIYLAMEGLTLRPPPCGNGDSASSALDCSPLVSNETTFPPYGSDDQRSALFQELRGFYEDFNLILTTERPPHWVPYTMAVVGGTASQAGLGAGVCGVANVACDGLKRNHVSLTFTDCGNGGMAETAAQETSHNWGLEHTDNTTDLLYPFNNGGVKRFVDDCMAINHATGDGVTQCGYIHEEYCPAGGGEEQNSYAELLEIFGPREVDDVAPSIVSISPEDGAVLSTQDTFTVTASVEENSNFLAVKWTWLEGLPEDTESFTRCTNKTCDQNYSIGVGTDPNGMQWDFLNLNKPPAGTYSFKLEVADAYGNTDSRTITVEVQGAGGGGDSGGNDSGDGGDADGDGGEGSGGDGDDLPGDDGGTGGDDGGGTGGTGDTAGQGEDDGGGSGCAVPGPAPRVAGWMSLLLIGAGLRRRRRS